ncbi:MAG: 4Fe-4S cluster-binding domain-containing protein [Spirochaetaceae bacterium]
MNRGHARAVSLHRSGELAERAGRAVAALEECELCPRRCGVNRVAGEIGVCRVGRLANVASASPHFGEERPLVGTHGSGTVFFSGCNLRCSFCQNCDISHEAVGVEVDAAGLARIMLELQSHNCENINLVTPSHVVPQILEALDVALREGLDIPIVYNSSAYDSLETLRLLDGVVDIYMPDFKFWHGEGARWLDGVTDYADVATAAVREMHRQVGDLEIVRGVAVSGLLVRHLVMPRGAANSRAIMRFLASLSPETYVNVMGQYRPAHRARRDPVIGTSSTYEEVAGAVEAARDAGLRRIDGHI